MELGPADGTLTLRTGRAGAAAKAGHDLTIVVQRWSLSLDPSGTMAFHADVKSLLVTRGDGGLKPLTDKDKATILGHAMETLKADDYPLIAVQADSLTRGAETFEATVRIVGVDRTIPISVTASGTDPNQITAEATITQTSFGLKPYTGLLGALKVADDVAITLDVRLPA